LGKITNCACHSFTFLAINLRGQRVRYSEAVGNRSICVWCRRLAQESCPLAAWRNAGLALKVSARVNKEYLDFVRSCPWCADCIRIFKVKLKVQISRCYLLNLESEVERLLSCSLTCGPHLTAKNKLRLNNTRCSDFFIQGLTNRLDWFWE
jgi:hypothetical protein